MHRDQRCIANHYTTVSVNDGVRAKEDVAANADRAAVSVQHDPGFQPRGIADFDAPRTGIGNSATHVYSCAEKPW